MWYCLPHNWPWAGSAVPPKNQGQCWPHVRFRCGEYPFKVETQCMQFLKLSYSQFSLTSSLLDRKGHTRVVNGYLLWYLGMENISVKSQHDACNSWGIIAFIRSFDVTLSHHQSDWNIRKSHILHKLAKSFFLWCNIFCKWSKQLLTVVKNLNFLIE